MAIRNSNLKSRKEGTNGGPRWNPFSDLINVVQECILATKMVLQETPLMGTYRTSIPKERKPKIFKKRLLLLH